MRKVVRRVGEHDRGVGRLGGGEATQVRCPLGRVVTEPAADLDRVVAEVGKGKLDEPPAVVDGGRETLEHLFLNPLISCYFYHASIPHDLSPICIGPTE